jgi:hypothetical protein
LVLVAAIACGATGYFAGRASAQAPQPSFTDLPYDVPSLMPVP